MHRSAQPISHHNNFDLLRFIAATLVILTHSYTAAGQMPQEPLVAWLGKHRDWGFKAFNLGMIGVHIFFVISGYLVTASYERRREGYIARRLLRIMPGLTASILFCCFIIGPVFYQFSWGSYFTSPELYRYLSFAFIFPMVDYFTIPGLFDPVFPYSCPGLNISLWTIPWEIICYFTLPLLCKPSGYTKKHGIYALLAVLFFYWRLQEINFVGGVVDCLYFFAGFGLYRCRGYFRRLYDIRIGLIVFCALLSVYKTSLGDFVYFFTIPYLTIYFACHIKIWPDFAKVVKGDYSYGLYIYAWPIQQALVGLSNNSLEPWLMFIMSFSLTFLMAVLSWHCIEMPWLRKKPQ